MAANITEIDAKVVHRLKDVGAKADQSNRYSAIASAVAEYQKARPLEAALELTGNGGFDFAIASLTGFEDGFSIVRDIYFPYLVTDQNPPKLDKGAWAITRLPTGLVLRLRYVSPSAAQKLAVLYTKAHTLSAGASTVYAADDEALADLGASYAFEELAAFATQETDNVIQADTTNRLSKAAEYRAAAKLMREAYARKMSQTGSLEAALAFVAIQVPSSSGTSSSLFHR